MMVLRILALLVAAGLGTIGAFLLLLSVQFAGSGVAGIPLGYACLFFLGAGILVVQYNPFGR